MLQLTIPSQEYWDEVHEVFITSKEYVLQLEHSLISLSKWESTWNKPFLVKENKTDAESNDYVRCMTLTQNVDPEAYLHLTQQNLDDVSAYIALSMTATTFAANHKKATSGEIITAEIIYFWMINFNIPFECQKWHLNRLLTLINVCNLKNQPGKKMSKAEILARNRELNAKRRSMLNTKG